LITDSSQYDRLKYVPKSAIDAALPDDFAGGRARRD